MIGVHFTHALDNSTDMTANVGKHFENLSIVERIGSILSLTGTIFIVVTFLSSTSFHKPINRLVFYAAIGNMASTIATLISRSALVHGDFNSALCQTQAFLIQMFMPADVLWAFAMSLNVYFTFYWHYNAADLRGLELYYIMICYGIPFIPALIFLFISTAQKGRVYGDATLWCWIAPGWDIFRIATFYGIAWIAILVSLSIYIRAGKDIWIKRQQLRNNSALSPNPIMIMKDPFFSEPIGQVMVSHTIETRSEHLNSSCNMKSPRPALPGALSPFSVDYSIEISASPQRTTNINTGSSRSSSIQHGRRCRRNDSSIEDSHNTPVRRYATMEANRAIWSYTKVSALFFAAMMITWIPSSANRVYSLMYHGRVNYALDFVSAFVLPLQGLWNAIIYSTTSLEACRHDWNRIREGILLRSGLHAFGSSPAAVSHSTSKSPYLPGSESVNEAPDKA